MPTNNNINYGPAPLPGTAPEPVLGNNIDRAPAAVPPGAGLGTTSSAPKPIVPVIEQPVVVPIPITNPVIPVTEQPVDVGGNANAVAGPNLTATNQQRFITVLANGTVVATNVSTLNFSGNGVAVASSGLYSANIVITAGNGGGGGNTFTSITMTNTPMAASNVIQYGLGNLISWLDGEWTIGEFNGNLSAPNSGLGNEGIRIDPGIESNAGMSIPGVLNQSSQPLYIYSSAGGGIQLYPGGSGSFVFAQNGNLTLPTNSSNINYANGVSILDGIGGGNYGNSNVSTFLAAYGANTISTTGNITGGNIKGNIQASDGNGAVQFNKNGFLGAAAGFNYVESSGALFSKSINGTGDPVSGDGAVYGGLEGFTQLGSTVLAQFTGNVNSYVQINMQNISTGDAASGDYIVTADNGTDSTYYVDLGLAGSNHADPAFFGDTATHNDAYLYVVANDQAGPFSNSGNLILGSTNGVIKLFTGNTAQANVVATVNSSGLTMAGTGGDITMTSGNITGFNTMVGDQANVDLIAGSYTWTFDTTGNLATPGNIIVNGRQALWTYSNTGLTLTSNIQVDNSGFSAEDGGDAQVYANVNVEIVSNTGGNAQIWTFSNTGTLTAPGNISANNFIGGGSNVDIVAGAYDWTFDNTGNLTTPTGAGDITMTGGNITGFNTMVGNQANVDLIAGSYTWTFDNTGNAVVPGNGTVTTANAVGGLGGNSINITAGASDPNTWNSNPGGALNLRGGYGSFADGGGGAGGDVNLYAGASSDTVSGNVTINTGNSGEHTWQFDHNGDLTVANDIFAKASNDLNVKVFNPDAGGGVTFSVQNRQVDAGNARTTQFEVAPANISLTTDFSGNKYQWNFDNTGNLTLPGNTWAVNYANGTPVSLGGGGGSYGNANVVANLAALGSNPVSTTGNVTAGNLNTSGNVNALSAFVNAAAVITSGRIDVGTNLSAVGDVTGNNVTASGNVTAGGFYTGTGNISTGVGFVNAPNAKITYSLAVGGVSSNARIDVNGNISTTGTVSATANITGGNILTGGQISATGNITGGNLIGTLATGNSNIVLGASSAVITVGGAAAATVTSSGIQVQGLGRLLSPGGAAAITLNNNGANIPTVVVTGASTSTSTTTGALIVTGGAGVGGNLYVAGNTTTGNNAVVAGVTGTLLANSTASFFANVNSYTQITYQNKSTGADATADFILTADNGSDTVNYSDFGIINSGYDNLTPTNSLGNIVYAADTYLYAQGNVSNTSQSGGNLAIGTTVAGKTVKIFAGGNTASALVANISNTGISVTGNVTASNFIGNISITGNVIGTSPNVSLVAGSYTYTFDNTGILTMPTVGGDEGGQINFGNAVTNTTIGNPITVDIYRNQIRFYEGSSAKGLYIDLSDCPAGVGGEITYKASNLVNAGTYVTLDNIKATLTSSGNRGLSLATTTGSISAMIGGTYGMGASPYGSGASTNGVTTINTTPSGSIFNWGFAGQGDISTYILTDITNSRTYRITLQIGGGYSNNFISIERL